jgi:hypothetical protein
MPLNPLNSILVGTSEIIAHSTINRGFSRLYQNDQALQAAINDIAFLYTITADQKAALSGTYGYPSEVNKYVTDSDPRLIAADPNTYSLTNVAITSHPLGLTKANGTYSYALNLFAGDTGFDNTKIRGIWISCYGKMDAYAYGSRYGRVQAKLFDSGSYSTIWYFWGAASTSGSESMTGLVFVPVTAAQTTLYLSNSSSNGDVSTTIIGAMIKG